MAYSECRLATESARELANLANQLLELPPDQS